ncbi:MAG: lytic transglycosylase domain-containing protein [Pelovirga sp.]
MSVEAIKTSALFSPLQQSSAATMGATGPNKDFAAILNQLGSEQAHEPPSAEQALIQLKVTQLQMMQGLFSTIDDKDDSQPLLGMDAAAPFSLLDARQGQFLDKYRQNLPPLHQTPPAVDRDQIEQMIDRVAKKVKLAPELIRAVVTVESSYDPAAVSHAGAQGLMQLMPATAVDLGVRDSFDPLENLTGGSRYLTGLLNKYDGDLDHALAAYNWGQGNVDRHGLESMPTETRNYVAKVKQLLNSTSASV